MTVQTLDRAAVGLPITRAGISFMPIYLAGNSLPEIVTGPNSGIVIDELDSATVPTLIAKNPTNTPILVVEGEHFVGGLQNRTINSTVLVPENTELKIPVSCLERGRWGRNRSHRRSDAYAPRKVRRETTAGVNASLMHDGSRHGDQGAVWNAVDEVLATNQVSSETSAAEDLYQARRRDNTWSGLVEELIRIGPLPQQCGFAVAHGSRVVAVEMFGAPHLFAAHWEALVRSHLFERPAQGGFPSTTWVLRMIRRFGETASRAEPGVGMGVERRLREPKVTGQALFLEDSPVHASIFAR
ncbi:MAG: hypothetical protein OXN89_25775 [Bryobacterales bacterium]|nr:hypothetical protein [Bryobacterales bacterium]